MSLHARSPQEEAQRRSTCQIEVHVHCRDVVPHQAEGEWSRLAPLRILSVDIECAAEKVLCVVVCCIGYCVVMSM